MKSAEKKPIWYLELPAYRYNEDVQELARAAGLRIIDAAVTSDRTDAAPDEELPVVTLREEFTPEYLAAQAAIVPVDKMEAAILERVRAEFRLMPYERQLAAYHATTGISQAEEAGADEPSPPATSAPAADDTSTEAKPAPRAKKGTAPAAEPEQDTPAE